MRHEWKTYQANQLFIRADMVELFEANKLTCVSTLAQLRHLQEVKAARTDRITSRFVLTDTTGSQETFFIKWHGPAPLKDWIKPILQLKRPIIGARNEFHAIRWFEESGIATTPAVAFGQTNTESLLITSELTGYRKLSEILNDPKCPPDVSQAIATQVACVAAQMHKAGLHHQDFYLGHLMVPQANVTSKPTVIDLGRVGKDMHLPTRWLVKDLAQLCYSARKLAPAFVATFLTEYFEQHPRDDELSLRTRIERKLKAISRHDRDACSVLTDQHSVSKAA